MILNLPNTGNFTVLNINYRSQTVTIKDPQNCLPQKFMNSSFDLSESPFIPELHDRFFTFLNCSSNSTTDLSELRHIKCLSNENFTVVAMPTFIYDSSSYRRVPSCTELKTRVAVPFPWNRRSDSVTRIKWNVPYCLSCEEDGGTCGFKGDTGMAIECRGRRGNGPLPRSAKYGIILGCWNTRTAVHLVTNRGWTSFAFGKYYMKYQREKLEDKSSILSGDLFHKPNSPPRPSQ
ncbi:hypothetical protein OIU78_013666 [Salix suchowensis]|nr:hypothetical protein OIU78_013666 [Salix suchowensis]